MPSLDCHPPIKRLAPWATQQHFPETPIAQGLKAINGHSRLPVKRAFSPYTRRRTAKKRLRAERYKRLTQSFGFDSIGNLINRTMSGARSENESFGYDTLDRLAGSTGSAFNDNGSYGYDNAGNLNSKAGLTLGYGTANNRLCGIAVVNATTCTGGTGAIGYDGNGNITGYTRPNIAGSDNATLSLSNYTAFNLPTRIVKTGGNTANASADFYYDAGYQRVRQVKFDAGNQPVDDILYVVPGGFELHRDTSGNVISSTATVSGPDGVIATVTTKFDPITGQAITQANATNLSGNNTVTKILLKDHLGSMVAEFTITTASGNAATAGTILVHGFGPWGNARAGLNADQRGFTGHEHLADLGLIHMNGRLYDPVLGRFLQADPIIQAVHNAQSHNRYVYVLNNPLSFTDPSGFSFWTNFRRPILALAAALTMQYYLMPMLLAGTSLGICGINYAVGNAITAMASGFAAGGIAGGNIQSALQGAFTAGVTFGLASGFDLHGAAAFGEGKHLGQIALHSAMGCGSSAMAGGSCKSGAISGGVSAFASPLLPANRVGRLVGSSAIGAVASKLSGGKAENGALTAAFSYTNKCS